MNAATAPTPAYLKTLVDCLTRMRADGYKDDFTVKDDCLLSFGTGKSYKPEEVKIVNFFRFEGQTDPADASILYVIETKDGARGTLVDGYGLSSDTDTSEFILQVEKIEKKAKS